MVEIRSTGDTVRLYGFGLNAYGQIMSEINIGLSNPISEPRLVDLDLFKPVFMRVLKLCLLACILLTVTQVLMTVTSVLMTVTPVLMTVTPVLMTVTS
jgi:hypothetical protein